MDHYVIDANRLVNDIKGYVVQLKSIYFENKDPIDDNELVLQKLCVKLETALRHGLKDKFTFLGARKDYWNFFVECLPKDEGTRYVASLSQLQTSQGKGRALIRYCLVQKTLADTIQRTLMHKKRIEWYTSDALLLNSSLSSDLIGKLYDLNELEFHLSCMGCDLDMSWPSFGRTFTDGYDRKTRRNSGGSIASTADFFNERSDPLIALNAEISAIKLMIAKEMEGEKVSADDGIWECSMSSVGDDEIPNINDLTLDLSRLHQALLKWKSLNDTKLYKAEHEIQRFKLENERLSESSDAQLKQLLEKHENSSAIASKETSLQINDMQNKLRTADMSIKDYQTSIENLKNDLQKMSMQHKDSQATILELEKQLNKSQGVVSDLENDVMKSKGIIETQTIECKRLTGELTSFKSKITSLHENEVNYRKRLEETESQLRVKTLEKNKIQEAFESVNGLVFASFEDFENFYKSQLLDKEKGLELKEGENRKLLQRLSQLTEENETLKKQIIKEENLDTMEEQVSGSKDLWNETNDKLNYCLKTITQVDLYLSNWLSLWKSDNVDATLDNDDMECKLSKLDVYIKSDKETLKNMLKENNRLDLECTAAHENNLRLLQLNTECEDEKENFRREKRDIEDKLNVLVEEKKKLQKTVDSISEEAYAYEKLNAKLEEESYLKLGLENEISEITELLKKKQTEHEDALVEIDALKLNGEKAIDKLQDLDVERIRYKDELELAMANLDTSKKKCDQLEDVVNESHCEVKTLKEQLKAYEEKLSTLKSTMEQEVSSLKFQLSSEALKYDEEIKMLSEEKREAFSLRKKIEEYEDVVTELENTLKDRNETWQAEKKKMSSDIKLLKNEIKVLNNHIDEGKKDILAMENTLALSKKKYEKERNKSLEFKKTIKEIQNEKSDREKILEEEKSELEEDIKLLKSKLIALLSDKSELWKKSAELEHDMKRRLSDSWVEDRNATRCFQCDTEFTLFLRKHHCRFCGNVFCHNCSDKYIKTIHSRKPYRACASCYKKEKALKADPSLRRTSIDQDASNQSISSHESDNEEISIATPKKGTAHEKAWENLQKTSTPELTPSDDIRESFQIIDEEEIREAFLSITLQNNEESIKHSSVIIPDEPGCENWHEVTLPAGKRYIVNAETLADSELMVEFTSSEQAILFGASLEETESQGEPKSLKTLIPFCQVNSHERCAKKYLKTSTSGILMLLFGNQEYPKSCQQNLKFRICQKEASTKNDSNVNCVLFIQT